MTGVVDVAGSTFQTGDTINGTPNANNKVVITDAGAAAAVTATVNNVAEIKHNLLASNTYNEAVYSGVAEEFITNSTGTVAAPVALTLNNAQLATVFGAKDSTAGSTTLNVGIRASDLTGTANTLNLSVRNAGSTIVQAGVAPVSNQVTINSTSTGIEAIALVTSGVNNIVITDTPAAGVPTDYALMTVTGDGANTIDVSALGQTTTFNLKDSTGANTLNFGTALASNTVIQGGTAADTLRVNQNSVQAGISLTGVETLRSSTGASTGTIAFTTSSLNTIRVDGDAAESGRLTLVAPGSVATINYIGDGLAAGAAAVEQFKALTITGSYAGASDAVTVNLSNAGTTNLAGYTLNAGGAGAAIDADGIETMVVNATNIAAAGRTTFTGGVASNTLQSISFVSAGSVNTGIIDAAPNAGNSALTMVDLSGITATAASTVSFDTVESVGAATQVRGPQGTGALTINTGVQGAADTLIVTGGLGNTTVNAFTAAAAGDAFAGTLTFTSTTAGVTNALNVGEQGAGATTSVTVATFSGAGSVNTITGGVGVDTITVTANGLGSTNTVVGAAGADVINVLASTIGVAVAGQAGNDTITLGAGSDTLGFTGGALGAVTGTIAQVTANVGTDAVTGYNVAADSITLSQASFGSTSTGAVGALVAGKFSSVATAATVVNVDYQAGGFLYNQATGDILYTVSDMTAAATDTIAESLAAGESVIIANLVGAPAIVVGEFTVIA